MYLLKCKYARGLAGTPRKAIGSLPDSGVLIVLTVVYTEREEDGKETIRIISARRADKHESRRYSRLS
jgi:uncharacterized DUF497 family protein